MCSSTVSLGLMVTPAACSAFSQVLDRDVGLERLVREVETDGLGEEVLERHLVDPLGAGPRVEMHGCVDVRAGVVAHGQRQRGG